MHRSYCAPIAALLVFTVVACVKGGLVASAQDRDCADFASQYEAQAHFEAGGGTASYDFDRLDEDHDGIACETLQFSSGTAYGGIPPGGGGSPGGGVSTYGGYASAPSATAGAYGDALGIVADSDNAAHDVAGRQADGDTGGSDTVAAAATARSIGSLEAAGDFDALYDLLHPDAQAIVPREVVVGWYQDEFAAKTPVGLTVAGVVVGSWIWPVTETLYPATATVSFVQTFRGNGSPTQVEGELRLVESGGQWRWFFGRSRAFLDEQISRYSGSTCDLVELYPGYPGYRGYVTGVDGVGDHACLNDLEAQQPGFSKAEQDSLNWQAAGRLGLADAPELWTWENWIAVEAERGLPPTCYTCAFAAADTRAEPLGTPIAPNDPRLLLAPSLVQTVMLGVAQDHGGGTQAWSDLYDYDFRMFAGLANGGGHLNAAETLDVMKRQMALLMGFERGTDGSFQTLNWMSFGRAIFAQGGYTPIPASAHPDDQVFVVRAATHALRAGGFGPYQMQVLESSVDRAVTPWRADLAKGATSLGFAAYLREQGLDDWFG